MKFVIARTSSVFEGARTSGGTDIINPVCWIARIRLNVNRFVCIQRASFKSRQRNEDFRKAMSVATGKRGKELDLIIDQLREGIVDFKQNEPSVEVIKK